MILLSQSAPTLYPYHDKRNDSESEEIDQSPGVKMKRTRMLGTPCGLLRASRRFLSASLFQDPRAYARVRERDGRMDGQTDRWQQYPFSQKGKGVANMIHLQIEKQVYQN